MKAGRELDALVAEKVMSKRMVNGWILETRQAACPDGIVGCLVLHYEDVPVRPPAYSTDIAAAWQVVEKLQGCELVMHDPESWSVFVQFAGMDWEVESADTAPLAICLAALRAVGAIAANDEDYGGHA